LNNNKNDSANHACPNFKDISLIAGVIKLDPKRTIAN